MIAVRVTNQPNVIRHAFASKVVRFVGRPTIARELPFSAIDPDTLLNTDGSTLLNTDGSTILNTRT